MKSFFGGWYVLGDSLADSFGEGDPVDSFASFVTAQNVNHLIDSSTQERVSYVRANGETPLAYPVADRFQGVIAHWSTPWALLGPGEYARPVLRIGAHVTSGAGIILWPFLYPLRARPTPGFGNGEIAAFSPVIVTNTSPQIVIEEAGTMNEFPAHQATWATVPVTRREANPSLVTTAAQRAVPMARLVIFASEDTTGENDGDIILDLVQLREVTR